jgi:hypothetical protein
MVKSLPSVQTERGLCRAWLRQVLNQNGVEYNIKAMLRQKTQVAAAYGAHALFRKAERMSLCLAHLQSLNGIGFDLQVNSDAFDDGDIALPPKDSAVARLLLSRLPPGASAEGLFDDDQLCAADGARRSGAAAGAELDRAAEQSASALDRCDLGTDPSAAAAAAAAASSAAASPSSSHLIGSTSSAATTSSAIGAERGGSGGAAGATMISVRGAGLNAANGVYTEVSRTLKDGVGWYDHSAGFEIFRFRAAPTAPPSAAQDTETKIMWYLGRPADKKVYYFCVSADATPPLSEQWQARVDDAAPAPSFELGDGGGGGGGAAARGGAPSQFSAVVMRSAVTAVQVKKVAVRSKAKKKKKKKGAKESEASISSGNVSSSRRSKKSKKAKAAKAAARGDEGDDLSRPASGTLGAQSLIIAAQTASPPKGSASDSAASSSARSPAATSGTDATSAPRTPVPSGSTSVFSTPPRARGAEAQAPHVTVTGVESDSARTQARAFSIERRPSEGPFCISFCFALLSHSFFFCLPSFSFLLFALLIFSSSSILSHLRSERPRLLEARRLARH